RACKRWLEPVASIRSVSRMTVVGEGTVRRYLQLLELAEELQEGLAAGEVKNTEALARLAKKFTNPEKQLEVWESISGFRQDIQLDVLKGLDPALHNRDDLRTLAHESTITIP